MQLIYLYIQDIKRNIENQELQFGNGFNVKYDPKTREMNIEKKDNEFILDYGPNINSVDLILGKNGSGKSTIMELLGLSCHNRYQKFPLYKSQPRFTMPDDTDYKNFCIWFAVYHLVDDYFVIEGYHSKAIKLLDAIQDSAKPTYSVCFQYDCLNQKVINDISFLQEKNKVTGTCFLKSIFYGFYQNPNGLQWLNHDGFERNNYYEDLLFPRQYMEHNGYEAIVNYLFEATRSNSEFSKTLSSVPGAHVEIKLVRSKKKEYAKYSSMPSVNPGEEELREIDGAATLIYGGERALFEPQYPDIRKSLGLPAEEVKFNDRESMIIMYLEDAACYLVSQKIESFAYKSVGEIQKIIESYGNEYPNNHEKDEYSCIKKHLFNLIENCYGDEMIDLELCQGIVEGLESIPLEYFEDAENISIHLRDINKNFLCKLTRALDDNNFQDERHVLNHQALIRINFDELSAGEAYFVDLYAAIYNKIRTIINASSLSKTTCILLLDEPDASFHPEWSRQFILKLTEALTRPPFDNLNYQLIISSHSPILVTDILSKNIKCLKRNGSKIIVEEARHGFLSRIDDVLLDDFFSDSVFGGFAEKYVNDIIRKIEELEEKVKERKIEENELKSTRIMIDSIGDSFILESLTLRLNRIIRKNERRR